MLISKNFDVFKTPHLVSMNIMTENGFGFFFIIIIIIIEFYHLGFIMSYATKNKPNFL